MIGQIVTGCLPTFVGNISGRIPSTENGSVDFSHFQVRITVDHAQKKSYQETLRSHCAVLVWQRTLTKNVNVLFVTDTDPDGLKAVAAILTQADGRF